MNISGLSDSTGFKIDVHYEYYFKSFSTENFLHREDTYDDLLNNVNNPTQILNIIQLIISGLLILSALLYPNSINALIITPVIILFNLLLIILSCFFNLFPLMTLSNKQWHYAEHQLVEYLFHNTLETQIENVKNYNPYSEGCSTNHEIKNIIHTIFIGLFLILIPLIIIDSLFFYAAFALNFSAIIVYSFKNSIFRFTQMHLFLARPTESQYTETSKILEEIIIWLKKIGAQPA